MISIPDSLMPINQMGGVQQNLPQLAENTPFRNLKDYQDYLSRLNQVSSAVDQTMDVLKKGLAEKIVPPKITMRDVAGQIQAQVVKNPEESPFYIPFQQFPDSDTVNPIETPSAIRQESHCRSDCAHLSEAVTFWN